MRIASWWERLVTLTRRASAARPSRRDYILSDLHISRRKTACSRLRDCSMPSLARGPTAYITAQYVNDIIESPECALRRLSY